MATLPIPAQQKQQGHKQLNNDLHYFHNKNIKIRTTQNAYGNHILKLNLNNYITLMNFITS